MNRAFVLVCLLLFISARTSAPAQRAPYSKATLHSFVEQTSEFEEWRHTHQLDTMRGWKYFKRWQNEQLMRCDGSGNLVRPDVYMREMVLASSRLEQRGMNIASQQWTSLGPHDQPQSAVTNMQPGLGRVNCIAVDPRDTMILYMGVAQGGVWKSTDNGSTWSAKCEGLPILRISDIAVDPSNTEVLYAALGDIEYVQFGVLAYGNKRNTYYGMGIFKSTNGGESWKPTALAYTLENEESSLISRISINPRDTRQLVVGALGGIFVSNDAGASWTQVTTVFCWDLKRDPSDASTLYATTGYLSRSKIGQASIIKSTDYGMTWKTLPSGIPQRDSVERVLIAIAPSDPRVLYAIATNRANGLHAVYRSPDAGSSWNRVFDSLNILEWSRGKSAGGQGSYDLVLQVNARDPNTVYAGGVNLWTSTDGGKQFHPSSYWTAQFGPSIHADLHRMICDERTGFYYVCTDGGVVRSRQITATPWRQLDSSKKFTTAWEDLTHSCAITSFYRLSSSRTTDGRILAGAQDNATAYFNGTRWSGIIGGDGMDNWIDPNDATMLIGSSQYGSFVKTTNGNSYKPLMISDENAEWTTPFNANYARRGELYTAFGNVYKSSDYGETWKRLSQFQKDSTAYFPEASAMAVRASSPTTILVCKRPRYERSLKSQVFRSSDDGVSWHNVTAGLPDSLYFTSAEIADDDSLTAWVSCAGLSGAQKVYKTTDGGQHWINISYDLPNLPVHVVKQIPGTLPRLVLVGTDLGVYCTTDALHHWIPFSAGLPHCIVSDLEVNTAAKKIYASTFGRGVWSCDLITEAPVDVSVESISEDSSLVVYPSPVSATHSARISWYSPLRGGLELSLINMRGQVVRQVNVHKESDHFEYTLDLSGESGSYLLECSIGGHRSYRRLIVH